MADLQLLEALLGASTIPLVRLCLGVITRAAGRLDVEGEQLDHSAMRQELRTASLLLSADDESKGEEGEEGHGKAAMELLQKVCLPYLDILSRDCTAHAEGIQAVAEIVAGILQDPHLSAEAVVAVLRDGVCPLLVGGGEGEVPDSTERLVSLTSFLCGVFSRASPESLQRIPGCADQLSAMFPLLLSLLDHAPASTCHLQFFSLLPPFISPSHPRRLSAVWAMLQDVWCGRRLVEIDRLIFSLALLCCFSDVLIARDHTSPFAGEFPVSVSDLCPLLDVRAEGILWEVLEVGLRSSDPLDRKRSMYLLDRVLCSVRGGGGEVVSEGGVFWWREECEGVLRVVWEDLVLLLHTMEEKQVHIVKPVKSRMKTIIQATSAYIDGRSVLHISWLELALERVFDHTEAKSIVRWGLSEALSLELATSPLLLPLQWQFVFGPLLRVLSETWIYARNQHATPSDLCPPMAALLTSFLQAFLSHLPQLLRGAFLHGLLVAIEAANMPETPLLHMTHSLSLLPPAPLLGPSSLAVLRTIISRLDTARSLLRAAVMSFLLTTAASLTDLSVVGYCEVATVLGSVRTSDCLVFSSPTWSKMCEWLAAVCAVSGVPLSSFLTDSLCSLLHHGEHGQGVGLGYSPLAILIVLTVDAQLRGLQCLPVSFSLEQTLSSLLLPLTSVLSSASSRPYLSPHSLTLSLLTLTSLITTFLSGCSLSHTYWKGAQSVTGKMIYKCMLPWLPEMIQNLQDLLLKGSKNGAEISLPHITLLTSSLSAFHTFTTLYGFSWSAHPGTSPSHLATRAAETLLPALHSDTVTMLTPLVMGALCALGWVCEQDIALPPPSLSLLLRLPLSLSFTRPNTENTERLFERVEWGPIMERCEAAHWSILQYCLRHFPWPEASGGATSCRVDVSAVWTDVSAVWGVCADSVGAVANSQLPCVLGCLTQLLPRVELGVVPDTVQSCWSAVSVCLAALPFFLRLLLHPHLLLSPDSAAVEVVGEFCWELMALGERRSGVVNALATTLCAGWRGEVGERREWGGEKSEQGREGRERVLESLLRHKTLILQLCCFGSVHRKNIRSVVDSEQFVRSLGDQVAANCTTTSASEVQVDSSVRVTMLSFLVGVASSEGLAHFLPQFSTDIIHKLLELSVNKPRYFINSLTHRLKQRLLQTLLLLLPHLPPDREEGLAQEIMRLLQSDNQTSVRHLLEWVALLLMACRPHLVSSLLLPALQPESEFRLSRLPSLFVVCMHLSAAGSPEERERYCRSVLPVLFPWTTCHHFVVRLYAQRTVEVLWRAEKSVGEVEGQGHTLIDNCIPFLKKHSDAARFCKKLDQNIFISLIHPLSDLSIEVLFDFLPRLCGMVEEECVSAGDFRETWERWGGEKGAGGARVPLCCDSIALYDAVKRGREEKGEGGRGDVTRSIAHQLTGSQESGVLDGGGRGGWNEGRGDGWEAREGDVQKKITRWASGAGVLEELFPGVALSHGVEPERELGRLVLVASLLSKIPNLGGLCRTCEIFGVSELVLPSLAAVEDPQFTALSVSSQHWLKISEVRLPQLPSYLLAMRRAGYQLVGAEQTAQSKCVTSYDFRPCTVLLLGNEREGIPVQLLHLLQDCVQIPQLGMVRSLNVHVSGALLVWEYCKQHKLSDISK